MGEAKRRGMIAALDVFALTAADLPKVARLLPFTDYFPPSKEMSQALSCPSDHRDQAGVRDLAHTTRFIASAHRAKVQASRQNRDCLSCARKQTCRTTHPFPNRCPCALRLGASAAPKWGKSPKASEVPSGFARIALGTSGKTLGSLHDQSGRHDAAGTSGQCIHATLRSVLRRLDRSTPAFVSETAARSAYLSLELDPKTTDAQTAAAMLRLQSDQSAGRG